MAQVIVLFDHDNNDPDRLEYSKEDGEMYKQAIKEQKNGEVYSLEDVQSIIEQHV